MRPHADGGEMTGGPGRTNGGSGMGMGVSGGRGIVKMLM